MSPKIESVVIDPKAETDQGLLPGWVYFVAILGGSIAGYFVLKKIWHIFKDAGKNLQNK